MEAARLESDGPAWVIAWIAAASACSSCVRSDTLGTPPVEALAAAAFVAAAASFTASFWPALLKAIHALTTKIMKQTAAKTTAIQKTIVIIKPNSR